MLKLFLLFIALTIFLKTQFLTLLIKTFKCKAIDINKFSSTINIGYIYYFIACYKAYIKSCFFVINSIYYYYKLCIWPLSLTVVLRSDLFIVVVLNNHIINLTCFDYSGQKIDEYCFCLLCYHLIKQKKILRFFFLNKVNFIMFKIICLF